MKIEQRKVIHMTTDVLAAVLAPAIHEEAVAPQPRAVNTGRKEVKPE